MAAIMVGDVIGYSSMMEKSEEKTIARLVSCQALISEKVASLDGRIFNTAGMRRWRSFQAQLMPCAAPSRQA
jgi:hypothetical protein